MHEDADNPEIAAIAEIVPLPAFKDNYIWLLRRGRHAAVVDPGDAAPVRDYLERHALSLCAILVTHHHADHIGGIDALLAGSPAPIPVFGPDGEPVAALTHRLADGERIEIPRIGAAFDILGVPGHTRAHIAYYGRSVAETDAESESSNAFDGTLFCGDVLFSCGCGRVFEGTPPQMRASLARIAALPADTRIHPAHEYTLDNARFALAVEPHNAALAAWAAEAEKLRAAGQPTLPTTLRRELAVNPFLRWNAPEVVAAASRFSNRPLQEPDEVFAAIRAWKNDFR